MADRVGLGPVFAFEWLTRSRRWQSFALRSVFVMALLLGLASVWQSAMASTYLTTTQQLAHAGQAFFGMLTTLQLMLVLLAAPAATAGAICLDRARGSLAHVMVTDLSDAEIVLGKLAARLVPVLTLAACALPVAALGSLLGGIDPRALTASFAIAVGVAVLGCSMALALSVWIGKTHEVMTVVFAIWGVWLLALPIADGAIPGRPPHWLEVTNPFWLSGAPYDYPGETSWLEPLLFTLGCLMLSSGLAALAVWKVRPVYLDQVGRVPRAVKASRIVGWLRGRVRWVRGPSLDANPVLWREWHRNRPSRLIRWIWIIYATLSLGFSLWFVATGLSASPGGRAEFAASVNAIQGGFGLLLVSALAATVLSEERVRGSLDVLMTTPIPTRSILWGKWWGGFRRVPWLAVGPGLVTFFALPVQAAAWQVGLAYLVPILVVGQGAALASLGLALATWNARLGRAVTWTIALFIAATVGGPIAGSLLMAGTSPGDHSIRAYAGIAMIFGSPPINVALPAVLIIETTMPPDQYRHMIFGTIFWAIAYPLIALGLYLATLLTFERCLGRSPERPRRPGLDPDRFVTGSGWRTRPAAGRPPAHALNSAPPPR